MITRDLAYYIKLVDKVGVGCARTESNFERYSICGIDIREHDML